jgi:S1-C subfamily serine protease
MNPDIADYSPRLKGNSMKPPIVPVALTALMLGSFATADEPRRVAKADAAIAVEGVVRQIFRSERQSQTDYLVLIDVQRAEIRRATEPRPQYPAPGDVIYVHTSQPNAPGIADRSAAMPTERSAIRAYLAPRAGSGWNATYPDWFEVTAAAAPGGNSGAAPSATTENATPSGAGITTEMVRARDQIGFRVKSVTRGSAGQRAGLEVGDVIVGAKGELFKNGEQLASILRAGAATKLMVVDVNSGRVAQVELPADVAAAPGDSAPVPTPAPPATPTRSLGITADPVTMGQRTALKVIRVQPDSPAAKAGIEVNDVLVAADGVALTGPEQLGAVLRKAGPTLTLTVRNFRNGQDVPVKVEIGGAKVDAPVSPELKPAPGGGAGRLGVVSELSFFDVEACVKITEVQAGSPAERAGLKPGMLVLEANGQPTLHPDTLNEAVRKASDRLKLTVVEPASGRKGTVEIDLRGR